MPNGMRMSSPVMARPFPLPVPLAPVSVAAPLPGTVVVVAGVAGVAVVVVAVIVVGVAVNALENVQARVSSATVTWTVRVADTGPTTPLQSKAVTAQAPAVSGAGTVSTAV